MVHFDITLSLGPILLSKVETASITESSAYSNTDLSIDPASFVSINYNPNLSTFRKTLYIAF